MIAFLLSTQIDFIWILCLMPGSAVQDWDKLVQLHQGSVEDSQGLRHLSYEEGLRNWDLFSLEKHSFRGI